MPGTSGLGGAGATDTVGMMGNDPTSDEWEYEYEYDDTETESFYINLDLTSLNGTIRPPRARKSAASSPPATTSNTTPQPNPSNDSPPASPEEQYEDDDLQVPEQEMAPKDQIQIMELHTRNPIISYQNHIFSCSWADMLGTELLFSRPEADEPSPNPTVRQHQNYDLISANRVKIIGKKGNLVASSFETAEPDRARGQQTAELENEGISNIAPERKRPLTNQARFLERLMNAKRARGENDMVRTVFSLKRSAEFEARLRGWNRTEEQMAEFERLNRRALQGDVGAVEELEEFCDRLERRDQAMEGEGGEGEAEESGPSGMGGGS